MKILRDAGGGGGGGNVMAFDPATMAPEDMRAEPSLLSIKTVPDLVKSYVSAQKMIGANRVAVPGDNATPAQWNEFYSKVGRPETADKYSLPDDIQVDESLKPDPTKFATVQKMFHDAGLTPRQAKAVMGHYMRTMQENFTATKGATEQAHQQAVGSLKQEWGDKFQANVDIANSVLKKFGDEALMNEVKNGMGNNVQLIKALHKIGTAVLEDKDRAHGGGDLELTDQTRAIQEIDRLKTDAEFQKALGDARHVGHKVAVQRWSNLFAAAHPGKEVE